MDIIRNIEQTLDSLFNELRKRGCNADEIRDMKRSMMRKNFQYYLCLFKISATFVKHCLLDLELASQLCEAWELLYSYHYLMVNAEDRDETMIHFITESEVPPQLGGTHLVNE